MKDEQKSKSQLVAELKALRRRAARLESSIAGHGQVENALRESEGRLRAVVETANDAIITVDSRGDIIAWNNGAQVIFGYSVDDIIGQSLTLIMPERYREGHQNGLQRVASGEALKVIETTVELAGVRKNGSEFPMNLSIAAWKSGAEIFFTAIVCDITERKRDEAERLKSGEMLELIINNIPQAVLWKNRESVFLGCNKALAKIVGIDDPEDIVGKTDYDLSVTKKEADFYRKCDRWVMDSDTAKLGIDESLRRPNRTPAWLNTNKVPLHDAEGKVIGILVTFEDITERKQTEEALRKANDELEMRVKERTAELVNANKALRIEIAERKEMEDALRESETRYRLLAENSTGMIYRQLLPDGRYEYISPASIELVGYTPEEICNEPQLIRKTIHPDWVDWLEEQWKKLLHGDMASSYEYQIIHKSGETRWLHQRNVMISDDNGRPIAIEGMIIDVTTRKQAEHALKARNSELALLNSAGQAFSPVWK